MGKKSGRNVPDYTTQDGCFPSAAVSREGKQNGGLVYGDDVNGKRRSFYFMGLSNTYHRYACVVSSGTKYCAHVFALYMLVDQTIEILGAGHRHDWSSVVIWATSGKMAFGSYLALGKLITAPAAVIPLQDGHSKFVRYKKGLKDHQFRFAKADETAENPYHEFVTPPIASWFTMKGEGVSNEQLRALLSSFNYDKVSLPLIDSRFLTTINEYTPESFPKFTAQSVATSF